MSTTKCPDCTVEMVLRYDRNNPKTSPYFWGCLDYPKCKGTRRLNDSAAFYWWVCSDELKCKGKRDRDPPGCPNCNRKMVPKYASKNGFYFWGCPDFPKCKGTKNLDCPDCRRNMIPRCPNSAPPKIQPISYWRKKLDAI